LGAAKIYLIDKTKVYDAFLLLSIDRSIIFFSKSTRNLNSPSLASQIKTQSLSHTVSGAEKELKHKEEKEKRKEREVEMVGK
jgi:hypothetical protein